MATRARKDRGMASQRIVADYYREKGFLYAESTGSGRSGVDITGVPGLAVEVKARSGFNPLEWVRQARRESRAGLPLVVLRCNGQGEASVGEWIVLMALDDHTKLLAEAGYVPGREES